MLKTLPGFEDFDPTREVLRCLKPGTGLKDAPQAFSMKLKRVTIGINEAELYAQTETARHMMALRLLCAELG